MSGPMQWGHNLNPKPLKGCNRGECNLPLCNRGVFVTIRFHGTECDHVTKCNCSPFITLQAVVTMRDGFAICGKLQRLQGFYDVLGGQSSPHPSPK